MRNPLMKRILRNIKRDWTKHLGLFVMLTVTILVGTPFNVVLEVVSESVDNNETECRMEDGQFECAAPISAATEEYFAGLDATLATNFYFKDEAWDGDSTLLVFDTKDKLNIPVLFDGRFPVQTDEIVFDRVALRNHGLEIGDTTVIGGRTYKVVGTAAFTDYSSLFKNNTDLMMNTETFGVAMVSHAGFEAIEDSNSVVHRYSYRYDDRGMTESQLYKADTAIQQKLIANGESLLSFITRENNQSIMFLIGDLGTDGPSMKIFVYIIEVIIAFMFVIMTRDTIERESEIIGTLRSLGYRKSEILIHYLCPTFIVVSAAALVGNILAYTVMIGPYRDIYYTLYSVPPIHVRFHATSFIVSTVMPVVVILLINGLMIGSRLSLSPLKFLRHDLKKGRQRKPVRLPNLKFISRFRLRIILENRVNYLLLFIGIFFASFLLLFGIGFMPVFDRYEENIDRSLKYDYQYILKMPVEAEGGEKVSLSEMKTFFDKTGKDLEVLIYGIDEDSQFFDIEQLPHSERELVISTQLGGKLGLEPGDSLTLKDTKNDREYTFDIVGVCEHESSLGVFLARDAANALFGRDEGYFNVYLSDRPLDIDERFILKTITRADLLGAASQMLTSFESVIDFIKYFSILIYFVMMYVLTKVIIEKSALSISFLKVFGYNDREIGKVYLNASTVTVLLSLVLCIPLEVVSIKGVMELCTRLIDAYFRIDMPVEIYIYVIIAGIVTYFFVNTLHLRRIRRIPGCEALKTRE